MDFTNRFIDKSLKYIEPLALVVIALATVCGIYQEIVNACITKSIELSDLLLMFIYLEVFAMISNYLEEGHLPIRMPMYMAIVSLSRDLILVMTDMSDWRITSISVAMLIIAITITLIRWGQLKAVESDEHNGELD